MTHTNLLPGQQAHATQTSQLDNMAREVQQVFPALPQSVIMEDLRLTRSVDITIDNILEGRIIVPPQVLMCVFIFSFIPQGKLMFRHTEGQHTPTLV